MATFPSTLPQPLASGYSIKPESQMVETDMEIGTPRARRISTATHDKITLSWVFDDAQMAAFRTWFESASGAAGGASWFTILLPRGTGGLVSCDARFVGGQYQPTSLGALRWQVSAELRVR